MWNTDNYFWAYTHVIKFTGRANVAVNCED